MDHLDELENQSIFILREAYKNFKNLAMLWSIGKDSNVTTASERMGWYDGLTILETPPQFSHPPPHISSAFRAQFLLIH